MSFVLDASILLTVAFQEGRVGEVEPVLEQLETTTAVVPSIWPVEIANALAAAERRKRITGEKIRRFSDQLKVLPIEIDPEGALAVIERVLPIARTLHLTAYDALYLELAQRRGLPLATLDQRLAAAASQASIALMIG